MQERAPSNSTVSDSAVDMGTDNRNAIAVVKVPQGYDTRINVRLVPGRNIQFTPDVLGCQPRQGAPRRAAEPAALPERLADKIRDANKQVIDWLAKDTGNAQLFLTHPVEALIKAGVDLTRTEQKALNRTHRAVIDATVIAPGVKVAAFTVSAFRTGRVGNLKPGPRRADSREDDRGNASQGKR